ncbi:hypothetical protein D9M68_831390 [compost metagenome]
MDSIDFMLHLVELAYRQNPAAAELAQRYVGFVERRVEAALVVVFGVLQGAQAGDDLALHDLSNGLLRMVAVYRQLAGAIDVAAVWQPDLHRDDMLFE